MGCSSCSSCSPAGCNDNGGCTTGRCSKMNTYDWISAIGLYDPSGFNLVEVSFKNGARKDFYILNPWVHVTTGDMVVVETDSGLDLGRLTLSGELVRVQMKKKKINESRVKHKVIRRAHAKDIERLELARSLERPTLIKARVIARTMGLDMKLGDVEYQADKRKATFYYTADGRVDFRELVRAYASEFRVKIEMCQIGARQESSRIGGIGSCGRELCCSTWLSDFKTVTTSAARYQNIAINQSKLSGQCGRLKCCLNYELDNYLKALKHFPKKVDTLKTGRGKAVLVKTDIFKGLMFYAYAEEKIRGPLVAVHINRVKVIKEMNLKGEVPDQLLDSDALMEVEMEKEEEIKFADVTGEIELPDLKKNNRRRKKKRRPQSKNKGGHQRKDQKSPSNSGSTGGQKNRSSRHRNRSRNKNNSKGGNRAPKGPNSPSK